MAAAFAAWMIQTGPNLPPPTIVDIPAEATRERERAARDWGYLCRWREANQAILSGNVPSPDVIFIGDSITENWALADPDFFSGLHAGRGVSGQTSAQILVRFPEDVIALKPRAVHIMAGTNDIAGNGGPVTLEQVQNRIAAMAELARTHDIAVILASIPPAVDFFWNPGLQPARHIAAMNEWLRAYAARNGFLYIDYHSSLSEDASGRMKHAFSNDGVHPNRNGYAVMRPMTEAAIARALTRAAP